MSEIKNNIKKSFIAGIILITPLAITILVLRFVFEKIVGLIKPAISFTGLAKYTGGIELIADTIGVIFLIAFITFLGYIVKRGIGDKSFSVFENIMSKTPIVKVIYSSVREVSNTIISGGEKYDRVVLIDWPNADSDMIGFVTGECPKNLQKKYEEKVYSVFVPMSPNPTAGFLSIQKKSNIEDVDMSIEKGIKMVLTMGIVSEKEEESIPEILDDYTV